jgi:serine-type D-Ala-D-Ala carboxypeptidase (penicillin-binding protein 5/6)
MAASARLTARAAGFLAGAVLAACAALTAAAPSASASAASPAFAAPSAASAAFAAPSASAAPAAARGPGGVAAPAAAVENAATGALLWSRELNTERPMASITKVMTALIVIRSGGLGRQITIPYAALSYVRTHGASNAGLRPGDRLTAGQLLDALILPSGADAAYTLARVYGPGIPAFIAKMNATARLMGLSRTHFTNFDGLPYPTGYSTYSTPANLLTLGRAAMRSPLFRWIVDQRSYRLAAGSGHHAYLWRNTNPLLGHYPGAVGIKTGWTPYAGHCLLFEAVRNGRVLIGVTLDSPGTGSTVNGADATRILNWAFAQRNLHAPFSARCPPTCARCRPLPHSLLERRVLREPVLRGRHLRLACHEVHAVAPRVLLPLRRAVPVRLPGRPAAG